MEHVIKIPVDYASRPAFRQLQAVAGPMAHALFLTLWRELAYAAETAPRVGWLPDAQFKLFFQDWGDRIPPGATSCLVSSGGYLVEDGEGWYCAAFARENGHLNPYRLTREESGGHGLKLKNLKGRSEIEALHQAALFTDTSIFQRPDGQPMDADEISKVTLIVKLFDNCLGRRPRLTGEFSAGLVQDAWRVLNAVPQKDIERFSIWMLGLRDNPHPAVPRQTEALLEKFDKLFKLFEQIQES